MCVSVISFVNDDVVKTGVVSNLKKDVYDQDSFEWKISTAYINCHLARGKVSPFYVMQIKDTRESQ